MSDEKFLTFKVESFRKIPNPYQQKDLAEKTRYLFIYSE